MKKVRIPTADEPRVRRIQALRCIEYDGSPWAMAEYKYNGAWTSVIMAIERNGLARREDPPGPLPVGDVGTWELTQAGRKALEDYDYKTECTPLALDRDDEPRCP